MKARLRTLIVLAPLFVVASVHAEAPDPNAKKRLFLAGQQAYDAGRYEVAITAFEAAYKIAPSDLLVFDLAQAYRKKFVATGERVALDKAVELYRRFLASAHVGRERGMAGEALSDLFVMSARHIGELPSQRPEPVAKPAATEIMVVTEAAGAQVALDGRAPSLAPLLETVEPGDHHARVTAPGYFPAEVRVAAVEGRFIVSEARLQPKPGVLELSGRTGSLVQVDGAPVGNLPLQALELAPGKHQVAVRLRGFHPWEGELELVHGERFPVRTELQPTPARRAVRWVGIVAGAFAAVAIGTGVTWAAADHQAAAIHGRAQLTLADRDEYERARSLRDQARTATIVSLALGAGFAVTTAGLYWFDHR
jgi:tetratricopeptide (TPR) repeat protein